MNSKREKLPDLHQLIQKKDSYYQESPRTSHYNYSSSLIIRKLKMYLISRNIRKQMTAMNTILHELKNKRGVMSADLLIYTDIPGLLCDVMNNHNPPLIKCVLSCLLELSKHKLFYQQRHASIVIETTCRTLMILSKDIANLKLIYFGLQLLSQIFTHSVKESSINLTHVFGLVKELLFNYLFQRVHLNAMFLLRMVLKVEGFAHEDLLAVVHRGLTLLSKLKKHNERKFNKHISLATELMLFSLRLSRTERSGSNDLSSKNMDLVIRLIYSCILPYLQKVDLYKCHSGYMCRQLFCLLALYDRLDSKRLHKFSNHLASKGFLSLLPSINLHFNNKSVNNCVTTLLSQVLSRLASCLPLGDNEHQLIADGLLCLPADSATWLLCLGQSRLYKTHFVIIVYFYFVVLCAESCNNFSQLLPGLCLYIRSCSSSPSPAMLKAVWLLFAVSSLSQPQQSARRCMRQQAQAAGDRLVHWLRVVPLSSVYTHHPSLLLWAFSAYVTNNILQIGLMTLWLQDKKEPSLKEIESLVLSNSLAALCLLDVLSCCSMEVIPEAMTVLKATLNKDKVKERLELSMNIWNNLANILSLLSSPQPGSKVNNVCCLVFLACKVVPARPDAFLMSRIGYQLLRALRQPVADPVLEPLFHCQLFKLANIIVIKMNQVSDYRVLEAFLQDDHLLHCLVTSLSSANNTVVPPALRLLSYLHYYQRVYSIQMKKCLYLCGDTLLKLMTSPRSETVFACLQLLSSLSTSSNMTPLVALPPDISDLLVQTLYLDFQMLSLKSRSSWTCQRLLLEFCGTHNSKMELHLLTQPWTHTILHVALKTGGMSNVDVLEFLRVWLAGLQRRQVARPFSSRALCQDRMSTTLKDIATALVQHKQLDSLHRDIGSKIFSLGSCIPPQVLKTVQDKVLKNSVP